MTARFVLDESSWATATETDTEALTQAVHQLLERLDVARQRNEGVARHVDYYETDLGNQVQLWSALFDSRCPVRLDHDVGQRLMLALDQATEFDDAELDDYNAAFEGSERHSPGVVWAHACCRRQRQVAVLPLPLGGAPRGPVSVIVADVSIKLFFVTEESEHIGFFRSVILLENADEAMFACLAGSAFPTLDWADDVWRGLGHFSRPYIEVRKELVRCLGGLDDYGAASFHECLGGDHSQLPSVLSARIGCETSDENGRTKGHKPSERDRTRCYRGTSRVFWWHVKLKRHVDRIYFLYDFPSTLASLPDHGRIVVGIFRDHCILPN